VNVDSFVKSPSAQQAHGPEEIKGRCIHLRRGVSHTSFLNYAAGIRASASGFYCAAATTFAKSQRSSSFTADFPCNMDCNHDTSAEVETIVFKKQPETNWE
jgi:hypothetical protein